MEKDQKLIDWIRLIRSENVGPITFHALIEIYGDAEKALEAIPKMAAKGGRQKPIKICERGEAEREIENTTRKGAKIIASYDKKYPKLLRHIKDFPPIITIYGNESLLNQHIIGIVGARNSSANGCRFAEKLAYDLGQRGIIIASGLARGIDTEAHKGSLESGTIAVVAGGIDKIYPPENKDLFMKIGEKGVVIAEMPFGSIPRAQSFPRRNRIISGISQGIVVVEANLKSGSLITARMALEQDREVMAVPGSPLDPRCHGTNKLIKDGAHLIQSVEDVMDVINQLAKPDDYSLFEKEEDFIETRIRRLEDTELDRARPFVREKLSTTPTAVDDIIYQTGLAANVVVAILLELELAGKLDRHSGNKVSLGFAEADFYEEVGNF